MEKLKFPVSKEPLPPPQIQNMSDYARFVLANIRAMKVHSFKEREREYVDVPFKLK